MRLTANEVRGQTLRRFKSSRLRRQRASPFWVGLLSVRNTNRRIWEEVRSTDGSSRLRRQRASPFWVGLLSVRNTNRRIWEEVRSTDGSSRLFHSPIDELLVSKYPFSDAATAHPTSNLASALVCANKKSSRVIRSFSNE